LLKSSSKGSPKPVSERLVPLGEIVTTHGIDGWLRIKPYNPHTTLLVPSLQIWLEKEGARATHEIEASRPHKGQFLVKLSGIRGIAEAAPRVGSVLLVEEGALDSLSSGEYYHYQVIGLEVFDTKGKRVGTVARTWSTPGGEIYVVASESKEHLIPAVKEIIEKVDLAAGTMVINPPDGLLDL
jgi:16S rRNA processing protein RimM